MSEEENKKSTAKTSNKKAPVTKKVATKKKTSTVKKAPVKTATADSALQDIIAEMNKQRISRDQQISSLIEEVSSGFTTLSNSASKQEENHQKEMTGLYHSLQNTFGQIKGNNDENEEINLNIFKSLSDSMMSDHEQTLKEINAQGKLQDKKIEHMTKILEQRTGRNRLIAIPGAILAIVAVVYMFHVVDIMETAMTNISANMGLMQQDVNIIAGTMGNMSEDTASINTNMKDLNGNINQVKNDVTVMTRNVAPAMAGLRNVMPWSP